MNNKPSLESQFLVTLLAFTMLAYANVWMVRRDVAIRAEFAALTTPSVLPTSMKPQDTYVYVKREVTRQIKNAPKSSISRSTFPLPPGDVLPVTPNPGIGTGRFPFNSPVPLWEGSRGMNVVAGFSGPERSTRPLGQLVVPLETGGAFGILPLDSTGLSTPGVTLGPGGANIQRIRASRQFIAILVDGSLYVQSDGGDGVFNNRNDIVRRIFSPIRDTARGINLYIPITQVGIGDYRFEPIDIAGNELVFLLYADVWSPQPTTLPIPVPVQFPLQYIVKATLHSDVSVRKVEFPTLPTFPPNSIFIYKVEVGSSNTIAFLTTSGNLPNRPDRGIVLDPGSDETYGAGDPPPFDLYPSFTENVRDIDVAEDNTLLAVSHSSSLDPRNDSFDVYEFGQDRMPNTGDARERYAAIPLPQAGTFLIRSLQAEGMFANAPPWGSSQRMSEERVTAILKPIAPPGQDIMMFSEAGSGGFATGDETMFSFSFSDGNYVFYPSGAFTEMNNSVFLAGDPMVIGGPRIYGVKWGPY